MHKKIIISLFFVVCLYHYSYTQIVNISYVELKKAYENYDTAFFNRIHPHDLNIVSKSGKRIKGDCMGIHVVPYYDFYLNKNPLGEFDVEYEGKKMIMSIYGIYEDQELEYEFLFTGEKPMVIFKKGKRNWYKIKELQDCILVKESIKPWKLIYTPPSIE